MQGPAPQAPWESAFWFHSSDVACVKPWLVSPRPLAAPGLSSHHPKSDFRSPCPHCKRKFFGQSARFLSLALPSSSGLLPHALSAAFASAMLMPGFALSAWDTLSVLSFLDNTLLFGTSLRGLSVYFPSPLSCCGQHCGPDRMSGRPQPRALSASLSWCHVSGRTPAEGLVGVWLNQGTNRGGSAEKKGCTEFN